MEHLAVLFYFPNYLTTSSTAVALILTPCSSQDAKYTAVHCNYCYCLLIILAGMLVQLLLFFHKTSLGTEILVLMTVRMFSAHTEVRWFS